MDRNTVLIVGDRSQVIDYAIQSKVGLLILTGGKTLTEEQKKALVEAKLKSMTEEQKKALLQEKLKNMTEEQKRALIEAKKKKLEEQKNK